MKERQSCPLSLIHMKRIKPDRSHSAVRYSVYSDVIDYIIFVGIEKEGLTALEYFHCWGYLTSLGGKYGNSSCPILLRQVKT